jgi:murein DD-endopeptidase MepM/ murein hydrolase activator NlpD
MKHTLFALGSAFFCSTTLCTAAHAATMTVSPQGAQPGDAITVTILPAQGETIAAVGMNAFDTQNVKFFVRENGVTRALVGFPFDRTGGNYPLRARVNIEKNGETHEQILSASFRAGNRYYPTQRISMKSSTASTMSKKSALRAEKLLVQSAMRNTSPAPLWSGTWMKPASGRETSSYGRRRYVNGSWWGQHNGADVKASTGTPVRAANSGRVVLSRYLPTLRGNCIVVDHGANLFSIYMHLSQRLVSVGQSVARGQLIGKVGATGFVTGPHLHWETRIGWEPVDPNRILARGVNF